MEMYKKILNKRKELMLDNYCYPNVVYMTLLDYRQLILETTQEDLAYGTMFSFITDKIFDLKIRIDNQIEDIIVTLEKEEKNG